MFSTKLLKNAVASSVKYQQRAFIKTSTKAANIAVQQQQSNPVSHPIVPVYWKAENLIPEHKYTIDCTKYDLASKVGKDGVVAIPEDLKERVKATYASTGLVHMVNTGLSQQETMRQLSKIIITNPMTYKAGANSRDGIIENVYETGAPSSAHLHYHHEMAYVSKSPLNLSFICDEATPNKGWTFVSAQEQMTPEILKTQLGQKLKEKGLCYIRCLTDREAYTKAKHSEHTVYNHWQKSFETEDPEEACEIAQSRRLLTEWGKDPNGPGRYLITKYYVSAFEYCPNVYKNLMYASVADDAMWFDSWPGVSGLAPELRPLKLTYGDDTEFTRDEFREWVDMYDRFGVPIKWKVGDVGILCNYRWAHGRPAYFLEKGEKRHLGVVLGDLFSRVGDVPNKWI
jgi:hypothetical protein